MQVRVKGGNIDKIYEDVAKRQGVDTKLVKKILEGYLSICAREVDKLEEGEQYRIIRLGLIKRV